MKDSLEKNQGNCVLLPSNVPPRIQKQFDFSKFIKVLDS